MLKIEVIHELRCDDQILHLLLTADSWSPETCLLGNSFTSWVAGSIWVLGKLSLYSWKIPYLKHVKSPLPLLIILGVVMICGSFIRGDLFMLLTVGCSKLDGVCIRFIQGWWWVPLHVLQQRENLWLFS